MNLYKQLIFFKINKYKFKKIRTISIILLFLCCIYLIINVYTYKLFLNNFKDYFSNKDFASANSLLLTKQNLNPIKRIYYQKDLSTFFNDEISTLEYKLKNNEITNTEVLNYISEIKHYDFLDCSNCNLENLLDLASNGCFAKGLNLFNQNKFTEAYYIFSAVPYYSSNFDSSQNYMNKCKENIKSNIFEETDILCKNNYYSKALDALYEVTDILADDSSFNSRKSEIENMRSDFIAMQKSDLSSTNENNTSVETNTSLINSINSKTINTLSINSNSNFLINVNITDQKTYIYSGNSNNWSLIKTMVCSTGKTDEETPQGSFTIKEKGKWFFSEKYQQGGKFWVQFEGNYLFHSVPYDKSQKKVLDYTLGTPASHGCIRLSESDAKWFYDNIPSGSKVIINKQQ